MSEGERTVLNVGVLSIQGAFIEHEVMLKKAAEHVKEECHLVVSEVRKPEQMAGLHGLIIPGGESTTLSVFLGQNGFVETLKQWIFKGRTSNYVWGTCAGLILLANELKEQKREGQITLGGLDVECSRNVYGRQLSSFEAPIHLHTDDIVDQGQSEKNHFHGIFIRAPGITQVLSDQVTVLGSLETTREVVAVKQGNLMATSFHPELTTDMRWHLYFIREIIRGKQAQLN